VNAFKVFFHVFNKKIPNFLSSVSLPSSLKVSLVTFFRALSGHFDHKTPTSAANNPKILSKKRLKPREFWVTFSCSQGEKIFE
jgi:hypothetical protein